MFGDGEWHCWEWRLKMNSSAGATDGIFAFWQDGIQIYEYTNIDWIQTGGGAIADRSWNYVWLGGNNNNLHAGGSEEEQVYSIDDLVISTTPIGRSYTIGGASKRITIGKPVNLGGGLKLQID